MAKQGQFALDLLLSVDRGAGRLHRQIERGLRDAIRSGRLVPGTAVPSTRAVARELGVSRGVVTEAYAQLVAEGYLVARQGAPTRVAASPEPVAPAGRATRHPTYPPFDLMPGRPDLAAFPREQWLAATRRALRRMPDATLGYPDARGVAELRDALSAYLGRARAVAPDPERTVVCSGVTQGIVLLARLLRGQGERTIAVEDPGFHLHRWSLERAGLRPVGVPVDAQGLDVGALEASGARAVLVTPAHQMPTGVVLSPERRAALLTWAETVDGLVIEDDYDAEYRFDRGPVGALQGLSPERVVYAGSASKTFAHGLRLGWLVLPERLATPVAFERLAADGGGPVLEQLALADLVARGDLDRHLRRTRRDYRRRRGALLAALAEHLPDAEVTGVAAGLHALVLLPEETGEQALLARCGEAGVAVQGLGSLRVESCGRPGLVLGYAHLSEPAIARAVAALGEVVAATAPASPRGASSRAPRAPRRPAPARPPR
ncbi:MAG TPA: PLP-dependent aminotransferase family protein [Solirubrobacteraceae bacterium]|jgi:GntR family transcriptional regulator/MocR family aminotransferase